MGGAVNGVSQVAAIADGKQDQIDVASLGMAIGMGGLLGAANLPGSKTAMATLTVAGAAGTISAYQKGENYTAIACAAGTLLAGAAFGLSFTNKTRGPSTPAGVAPKTVSELFGNGSVKPKASDLIESATQQGWTQKPGTGPRTFVDANGQKRLVIKAPENRPGLDAGSNVPHVEAFDAAGQRIDPVSGLPTTRKSPGNHREIDFDVPLN